MKRMNFRMESRVLMLNKNTVMAAVIAALFALMVLRPAIVSADQKSKSTKIIGFPLPLHWGMSKQEIERAVRARGLHLAKRDKKTMQAMRYGSGRYYEWAAIKEEHVQFLGHRRFVVFRLDEQDRLASLSLKALLGLGETGTIAVAASTIKKLSGALGAPFKKANNKNKFIESSRLAWKVQNQTLLELELQTLKIGGKRDSTFYTNLYWDGS